MATKKAPPRRQKQPGLIDLHEAVVQRFGSGLHGQELMEAAILTQIEALNAIGAHLGMFGSHSRTSGLIDDPKERWKEPSGLENIEWALSMLLDADKHPLQHAAAGMVLQYYWPRWREEGPPVLIGAHIERGSQAVLDWRHRVLDRDGNRCRHCGSEDNLHVHHVVRWKDCPALRTVDTNGITLCERCHIQEHAKP